MNIQPSSKLTKLGDLVNILHQYHNIANYIYTDNLNAREMIEFLLTLFNGKLQSTNTKPDVIKFVNTTWTCDWPNEFGTMYWTPTRYTKACDLPQSQGDHVVCQFDIRTPVYWNRSIPNDEIDSICKSIKNIHNIGDKSLKFAENHTHYSLQEKYQLLANARAYIGINSGLSHLALMTNTPTYILYKKYNPWFFYPDNAVIIDSETFIKSLGRFI